MTLTKDAYLKASRALATGFGPTTDFADPQLGATVQHEGGIPEGTGSELPGQVFTVGQLPNPAVAVAYGLPPVTVPEHLILGDDVDPATHVQAMDPLDFASASLREELGNPVLTYDNSIRSEETALEAFEANTGAGLGDDELTAPKEGVFEDGVLVDGSSGNVEASSTTATADQEKADADEAQKKADDAEAKKKAAAAAKDKAGSQQ